MGVLRVLLRAIDVRRLGHVLRAVAALDVLPRGGERVTRDARRVGAHVGDEPDGAFLADLDTLVEALGDPHRARRLVAELPRGLLLEPRGDEGRRRVATAFLAFDGRDGPVGTPEAAERRVDLGLGPQAEVLVVELLAADLGETGGEGRRFPGLEARFDRPVLLGREGADRPLALADDAHRDRLHATRRQPTADLAPEKRRELVADEAIEDAAGLLRVEAVLVELARILQRLEHGLLGDLVEEDTVHVLPAPAELLGDVPGDRLTLAVGVGREVDVLLVLRRLLDLVEHLRLALDHVVLGGEVLLDVDAELRLGQVHHVPDRRLHLVVPPQVLAERLRLGGRFDDHQVLCHGSRVGGGGTALTRPGGRSACRVAAGRAHAARGRGASRARGPPGQQRVGSRRPRGAHPPRSPRARVVQLA